MAATIEAEGLRKRYGKTLALDGLDLVAERGEVVAVLGPNGAGKTTFVRAVATLLRLDAGALRVAGHDVAREPDAVRGAIGLAGQFAAIEPAMTGRENLEMVANLFGQSRRAAKRSAAGVLDQLGLTDAADRLARTYSGGMRRRLDLGASLVGAPRLLLLDEPTTGLDPRSRMELWEAIRALVEAGTDVLLTTQYLDEADQLADRIAVIDRGVKVAEGTPDELKSSVGSSTLQLQLADASDVETASSVVRRLLTEEPVLTPEAARMNVALENADQAADVLIALRQTGISITSVSVQKPTLDEVFMALTGHATESDDPADGDDAEAEADDRTLEVTR